MAEAVTIAALAAALVLQLVALRLNREAAEIRLRQIEENRHA